MNNIMRKLLFIVLLLLSPLATVALIGSIYVVVRILGGLDFAAALSSFRAVLSDFIPYFSYLTSIPAVLLFSALLMKKIHKKQ